MKKLSILQNRVLKSTRAKWSKSGFICYTLAAALVLASALVPVLVSSSDLVFRQANTAKVIMFKQNCFAAERLLSLYCANSADKKTLTKLLIEGKVEFSMPDELPDTLKALISKDPWGRKVTYYRYLPDSSEQATADLVARFVSPGPNGKIETDRNSSSCVGDDICFDITKKRLKALCLSALASEFQN